MRTETTVGGAEALSSLDLLTELDELMVSLLPLVPANDPLRDKLVQLEEKLRACRCPADDSGPALSTPEPLGLHPHGP